jgi:ATP-binding cassette, subfamily B, bacterial
LVGASGAGKSTLVSLIPRLFDPWQGAVLFDDIDIRQLTVSSVRDQVAMVLQEPFLLPLSIAENIAYARPNATRNEIVAAAVAAKADAFIDRLPRGLKDAPILILDEPTAALDARTEASLVEAIENLMRKRTTIVIAHRLSTIRRADRIVVIQDGQIVEQGTHDNLLSIDGYYKRLQQSAHPAQTSLTMSALVGGISQHD